MSDILGEHARLRDAFEQPTLRLLHQHHAPVVLSVFRLAFGRDNRPVPTARLHEQVETLLDELRAAGIDDLPRGGGRDLCMRWMRRRWLIRANSERDGEVYTLTSHAQEALELSRVLARERATLSEHRIATIVSAFRRFNTEANPDRTSRVTILGTEIARLQAERDRLVDGGDIVPATDDYMSEGYTELLSLIGALPSDFARVEEAFVRIRHDIHEAFRADDRPAGEVVDDYLARIDQLTTTTAEGRAFEGAFPLLRDEALLLQLREDIGDLLEHPASDRILGDADRREIRDTVKQIRAGLDRVLAERNRATATLRNNIAARDVDRDRELETVLRHLEGALQEWYAETGPRTQLGLPLLPERASVDHLRERLHDPADDAAPPPLVSTSPDHGGTASWAELRAAGGPSLLDLETALDEPGAETLGALFGALDPALRRPVEVIGLLHLAERRRLGDAEGTEQIETVRADGTRRRLRIPRVRTTAGVVEGDEDEG